MTYTRTDRPLLSQEFLHAYRPSQPAQGKELVFGGTTVVSVSTGTTAIRGAIRTSDAGGRIVKLCHEYPSTQVPKYPSTKRASVRIECPPRPLGIWVFGYLGISPPDTVS